MRPDLVCLALKEEIGPQGRSDEPGSIDLDHPGIEEVDPSPRAFLGEPGSRLVDLGPVELVVPEHVEDVRGTRPVLRELVNEPLGVGCEIACEDDDVRFRVVLWQEAAVLEMEVREDLNLHSVPSLAVNRFASARVLGPCSMSSGDIPWSHDPAPRPSQYDSSVCASLATFSSVSG